MDVPTNLVPPYPLKILHPALRHRIHVPKLQLPKHILWLLGFLPSLPALGPPVVDNFLTPPPHLPYAYSAKLEMRAQQGSSRFQGCRRCVGFRECSDRQGLGEEAVEAGMGLEGAAADGGGGFAEAHGGHDGDCKVGLGAREVVYGLVPLRLSGGGSSSQ